MLVVNAMNLKFNLLFHLKHHFPQTPNYIQKNNNHISFSGLPGCVFNRSNIKKQFVHVLCISQRLIFMSHFPHFWGKSKYICFADTNVTCIRVRITIMCSTYVMSVREKIYDIKLCTRLGMLQYERPVL